MAHSNVDAQDHAMRIRGAAKQDREHRIVIWKSSEVGPNAVTCGVGWGGLGGARAASKGQ
eukprot:14652087-Alexandrium_andersonii.AAC.1